MNPALAKTMSKLAAGEPPSARSALSYVESTPVSEIPMKKGRAKRSSSSWYGASDSQSFDMLPPIEDSVGKDAIRMLNAKLDQCRVVFQFGDPLAALQAKEDKRETLLEIVHYVVAHPNCLTKEVYPHLVKMIDCNIYRSLPPKLNPFGQEYDPEEDEPVLENAWPHLHIVYELLLRVLESPNFNRKQAKPYFKPQFAMHVLELFDSEDPRERDYLKMAAHRLYGRFLHLRTCMRERMAFMLIDYVDNPTLSGVAEIMEILGSIVNGFSVPLKQTHIDYLRQVLLPLMKPASFVVYHSQLLYCYLHFIIKDSSLARVILRYMTRHWPIQVARKQVIMLHCIDEMLLALDMSTVDDVADLTLRHLARTMRSPHFQVADKCFVLLENPKLQEYCRRHSAEVIPVLYKSLQCVVRTHWNGQLQQAAYRLQKWFNKLNPAVANQCAMEEEASSSSALASSSVSSASSDAKGNAWVKLSQLAQGKSEKDSKDKEQVSSRKFSSRLFRKSMLPLDVEMYEALSKHVLQSRDNNNNDEE